MQRPSRHAHFFSSLKQVEKRLKLEIPPQSPSSLSPTRPQPPASPPPLTQLEEQSRPLPPESALPAESNCLSTESLGSPIFLNIDQTVDANSSALQDSEPPREFLSNSPDFPPTHEDPLQLRNSQTLEHINEVESSGLDDVELLMQLLCLSDCRKGEDQKRDGLGLNCGGDDGFYGKIVGVKGPKCKNEVERLEGWIKHFLNGDGGEKTEPLRLAHLLLGKAAFISEDVDGFGGLGFPSTIDEFLQNDPPAD